MHRENHSDPSQEYSGFPEFAPHQEAEQFAEYQYHEESTALPEYFPLNGISMLKTPSKEKRKRSHRLLRKVVIALSAAIMVLTVAYSFRLQARVALESADQTRACLRVTVSGMDADAPVCYIVYQHFSGAPVSNGTLRNGQQILDVKYLLPDTVYRIEICSGEAVLRSFLFNTRIAQGSEPPVTEEPVQETTEPIETSAPTEAATEPATEPETEETTEPTEETTEPTEVPTEETTVPTQPPYIPPSGTQPPTEPPTEPATEPETEPPTEPATEPETEPPTEPATEPETEPPTEPATEPTY